MFKTRFLSSVVLVIMMIGGIFAGPAVFTALFMTISLIGMMELYRIYGIHKKTPGILGYVLAVLFDLFLYFGQEDFAHVILICGLILLMAVYVIGFPRYDTNQIMAAYFGFVYIGVMLSYVFRIRAMEDGLILIWLVFICSWINDTCAYLVGILIGKHKMTPKLSPKKTYEGAVGGIAGTALIAALYGFIFKNQMETIVNPPVACAIACSLGAILSIFGDLAASAIKRNHDVKDYGKLIPGHGGILDRFDSMIFTAPVIYWVVEMLFKM
ncbi:MAG: phosphatidate cytidylyltransferase [Thermoflexaceae bacterium]|nr:phosphatidate cytidylyltransferase [Thermoflexaceae bacterium]